PVLPASGLVEATAQLYRQSRASAHAAGMLREAFRVRATRRLGVPGDAEDRWAAEVGAAAGVDEAEVREAMETPAEPNERQLVTVARRLEELERRIEGGP
ncbi:MAG: hypothetical protein M3245_06020, partial [Actinomycetota bacterium]|nr:hypothetical protein [Actinomycetota bacterium]